MEVEEDNEVCDICREGYSEPGDMLVFCDRCNIAVHQGCYGIKEVPEGDWVCSVCAHGLRPSQVRCYICKQPGGAMHRTPEGFFIHLICAYYTPELSLNLNGPEVLVEGIARISRERAQLVCCLCGQRGAGCVQCSSRNCSVSFHPFCALKAGYLLTSDEKNGVFMYLSYCRDHTEKKRRKTEQPASADATPKKKRKMRKKKEKAKATVASIPDTVLQKWALAREVMRRIKTDEKENQFWCVDFWTCMKYFYAVQPDPQPLVAQLHFLHAFPALPALPAPAGVSSRCLTPQVLGYIAAVLQNNLLALAPMSFVRLLQKDTAFLIPALGSAAQPLQEAPVEDRVRTVAITPHGASNASFHRKQKLNFQGFDINDFADLRESHVCALDYDFIAWARGRGVCTNTSFRLAHKADVPWLLKINTINPTFSSEADYSGTFYEKNEFVIVAERKNDAGATVPVAMVHFYLMWYYPSSGKQREAVRAVYVCTLQRVARATHPAFVGQYRVEAEPMTGTMLLCLAFRQGQACQMSMGCCDSTDNSVSFYTQQFGMTALPRGEGRHYTPMQIPLSAFDARSVLLKHLPSDYHGTLLCRVHTAQTQTAASLLMDVLQPQTAAPQLIDVLHPQTVAPRVLHLRIDATGRLQSLQTLDTLPTTPSQQHLLRTCPQLFTPTQDTAQHVTTLGRVCDRDSDGRWFYLQQGVPHFYEFLAEEGELGEEPDCAIDYSAYVSQSGGAVIDSSELERELEASQNALFEATMQNERSLCGLLAAMVAGEAESEATQQLAAESDRLVKELKEYEMVKRPERVKEEEEEDNDAICEVCGDGDSNFGNVIIFCDGCDAAVHQCCYDLATLPKGDWFCNVCEDILVKKLGVRDVMHVTPKESAEDSDVVSGVASAVEVESEPSVLSVLDHLHELREKVFCCVCGYSKGAMMRTNEEGKYAHVACALWHPYCSVTNALPCCKEPMMVPATEEEKKEIAARATPVTLSRNASEAKSPSSEDTVLIPLLSQSAQSTHSTQLPQPTQSTQPAQLPLLPQPEQPNQPSHSLQPESQQSQQSQQPQQLQQPLLVAYHSPYDGLRANTELPRYCVDISHLGEQRRSLVCQLCRRKGGVVPCCCSGCGRGVHASCALKYELEMFWNNKIGHSGVPVEEVLVEKDFFIHCFNHSGGFQGRGVPHKRCDDYRSPLSEKETRRKRQNDEFVLTDAEQPTTRQRRQRRSAENMEASQQQGLERMRKKREKRRERERKRNDASRGRRRSDENALVFTTKPHSKKERRQRLVLEWLKASPCAAFLLDDANNLLLKIQRQIDAHLLPVHADWRGYTLDNGTLQSFYRRCKKRGFFQVHDLVIEIREMYLGLLSYCYPSPDPEKQAVAKLVCNDANELTRLMIQLENPVFFAHYLKTTEVYCVCMTTDGTSEFMVGCDACGRWFHPFCIGFAETKYFGFLTTYDRRFVDVREDTGCFFCPMCYAGENAAKMRLYSEAEVVAMGAKVIPGYQESESVEEVSSVQKESVAEQVPDVQKAVVEAAAAQKAVVEVPSVQKESVVTEEGKPAVQSFEGQTAREANQMIVETTPQTLPLNTADNQQPPIQDITEKEPPEREDKRPRLECHVCERNTPLKLHTVLGRLVDHLLHGHQLLHERRAAQNLDVLGVVVAHHLHELLVHLQRVVRHRLLDRLEHLLHVLHIALLVLLQPLHLVARQLQLRPLLVLVLLHELVQERYVSYPSLLTHSCASPSSAPGRTSRTSGTARPSRFPSPRRSSSTRPTRSTHS